MTTSSLSTSKKSSYNNDAEKDFSMILKQLKEVAQLPDSVIKKPLGIEMKNVVLSSLKSSNSNDETWKQAWNIIHQYTKELSYLSLPDPNLIIPLEAYNSLLTFLTSSSDKNMNMVNQAVQILDEMLMQSKVHPLPDLTTYTIVLEATCSAFKAEQAVQILLSMKDDDLLPTLHMYEIVIAACVKKNHWRRATQLLDLISKDIQQQGTVSISMQDKETISRISMLYSSVITSCAKSGEISKALKLFKDLRHQKLGFMPITSYNALMSACASSDRYWGDAIHIFDELTIAAKANSTDVPIPDIYTYTIAIRACARGRLLLAFSKILFFYLFASLKMLLISLI
jgi:pentatricopeptide repeat protein